jgi:hypothetical protein
MRSTTVTLTLALCIALGACEDEEGLTNGLDASALQDGASGDAALYPGAELDAAVSCGLERSYGYYYGSLLGTVHRSGLFPPATYAQIYWDGGLRCTITLPPCGSDAIDPGDVAQALRAEEVEAALAGGVTRYGQTGEFLSDRVPFTILSFDGGRLIVGDGPEVPASVAAVRRLLVALDQQGSDAGPCALAP